MPQLALDVASVFLLRGLLDGNSLPEHPRKESPSTQKVMPVGVVLIARVADVAYVHYHPHGFAFVHQYLDAMIVGAWAWKFREELDVSAVVMAYALAQIPYPALLPTPDVVLANQVLWQLIVTYVGLKLVLAFQLPKVMRKVCVPPLVEEGAPSLQA